METPYGIGTVSEINRRNRRAINNSVFVPFSNGFGESRRPSLPTSLSITTNFVCAWDWPEARVKMFMLFLGKLLMHEEHSSYNLLFYRIGLPK